MKEKPIVMSGESVLAILREESPKTQTRRVIKPQPIEEAWQGGTKFIRLLSGVSGFSNDTMVARFGNECSSALCDRKLPYQPGDILWVRETWAKVNIDGNYAPPCYQGEFYYYKADKSGIEACGAFDRWRSPRFMPRAAARIFLRVVSVRVERLQDISEADAIAEGMLLYTGWQSKDYTSAVANANLLRAKPPLGFSPRQRYEHIWNKLNGKRDHGAYAWEKNPWVVVTEFERLDDYK